MIINILLALAAVFVMMLGVTMVLHLIWLVPFVPTRGRVVKKMVELAQLNPQDVIVDLGCGDGRILIEAAKQTPAHVIGYEITPLVYIMGKLRLFIAQSRAKIRLGNMFNAPLHDATVIFCYLLPNVMPRLAEKIRAECKKGTRIVSHTFQIPGFETIKKFPKDAAAKLPTIYIYKV